MTRSLYLTARCTRGCEQLEHPRPSSGMFASDGVEAWPGFDDRSTRRSSSPSTCASLSERMPLTSSLCISPLRARIPKSARISPSTSGRADNCAARSPAYRRGCGGSPSGLNLDAGLPADEVIDLALEEASFRYLMPEGHREQFTSCPACGGTVMKLAMHQRTSTRCRTAAAANQVRDLWGLGHRDPWTAADRAPLTWVDLQLVRWRRRVILVEYPKYNAVLMAPAA